jgi:hypothetical protein
MKNKQFTYDFEGNLLFLPDKAAKEEKNIQKKENLLEAKENPNFMPEQKGSKQADASFEGTKRVNPVNIIHDYAKKRRRY